MNKAHVWYPGDSSASVKDRAKKGYPGEEAFRHICLNSYMNSLFHSFIHSANIEGYPDDTVLDSIERGQMLL